VSLYIPVNTSLRSVEGVLRLSTPEGYDVAREEVPVDLLRTDFGMFAAEMRLGPAADRTCRSLSVGLEIESCRGNSLAIIECPEIRVKAPQTFASLEVSGENLSICHDE